MAEYTGQVWLGSASGRQSITVNANTWQGAREQIKTIYNVTDGDIVNLDETRGGKVQTLSSNSMGWIIVGLIIFGVISVFNGETPNGFIDKSTSVERKK